MAKKAQGVMGALKNLDDISKLLTGKKLSKVLANAVELFGEDVLDKLPEKPTFDPNDPYYILGVHSGAPDAIVKAAFRSWARDLHPDTGAKPDPVRFTRVKEAYDKIMASRKTA